MATRSYECYCSPRGAESLLNAYLDSTYMQADFCSTRWPPPLKISSIVIWQRIFGAAAACACAWPFFDVIGYGVLAFSITFPKFSQKICDHRPRRIITPCAVQTTKQHGYISCSSRENSSVWFRRYASGSDARFWQFAQKAPVWCA